MRLALATILVATTAHAKPASRLMIDGSVGWGGTLDAEPTLVKEYRVGLSSALVELASNRWLDAGIGGELTTRAIESDVATRGLYVSAGVMLWTFSVGGRGKLIQVDDGMTTTTTFGYSLHTSIDVLQIGWCDQNKSCSDMNLAAYVELDYRAIASAYGPVAVSIGLTGHFPFFDY